MADLSQQDAQKIFEETSKALQENDSSKLSSLLSEEADQEAAPDEATPAPVSENEAGNTEPENVDAKEKTEAPPSPAEPAEESAAAPPSAESAELDALRQKLEALSKENHSLRSQAGRVPHIQRRLKELDDKLEELEKTKSSPSSVPSTKIRPKVDELLKSVKDTDPELADAIAKAIVAATAGLAEESHAKQIENVQLLRNRELLEYQEVQAARLLEMFPNAKEVFQDPHWAKWKSAQTDKVQQLAESDNADDVAWAFTKYASDMASLYPELAQTNSRQVNAAAAADESEQAKKIEAERARKQKASVIVGGAPSPSGTGLPDDPAALFAKFSEQIRKERIG